MLIPFRVRKTMSKFLLHQAFGFVYLDQHVEVSQTAIPTTEMLSHGMSHLEIHLAQTHSGLV